MATQTPSSRPAPAAPLKVGPKKAASAQPTPTPARRKASAGAAVPAASPAPAAAARPQAALPPSASSSKSGKAQSGAKAAKADKPRKAEAEKKPKLVRDSFTMPKPEYEVIAALKLRAAKMGQTPKKSELLRAGIKALAALNDAALLASLAAVPAIKTGRPKA